MAITLNDFFQHFGRDRFTKADLWSAFGHNSGPGFPTDDFMAMLALDARDYIEQAPGPRGGEGWRLTSQAVSDCTASERKAHRQLEAIRTLVDATTVPYGELRYLEYAQAIEWRLRLPFDFSRYRGPLKSEPRQLSFTIKTKGASQRKVKGLLEANCKILRREIELAVQTEQTFLEQRQSSLSAWLASLSPRHQAVETNEDWIDAEETRLATQSLLRDAIARAEAAWPHQCMAMTTTKQRCGHKGKSVVVPMSQRPVKLCARHAHLVHTPDTIPSWPANCPTATTMATALTE